jgi:release factor glutamine methyltransferase
MTVATRFYGVDLQVDDRVFIPCKETGLLVEVAKELPERARVHEVGTGSGAVSLALAKARPDLVISASDISPAACAWATHNAARHGLPISIICRPGLPLELLAGDIDLVLANLPYLSDEALALRPPEVHEEPNIATQGNCGPDGLGEIRKLIEETPSGWKLALEHDTHHGSAVRKMLVNADTRLDYCGDERVTVGVAP